MRRVLMVGAATAGLVGSAIGTASAHPTGAPIGPHQLFIGLVNGSRGVEAPVAILVVCPGPGDQTGHPVAGQTLEVLPASSVAGAGTGNTGPSAHQVAAVFGAPPPAGAAAAGVADFHRYGVVKTLATSLVVPCSGTSTVYFVPLPVLPGAQLAPVPVVFANIAAASHLRR